MHFVQTSSSLNFGQKISSLTRYHFSRLNLVRIATILSGMKSLNHAVRFLFVQDTIMTCLWHGCIHISGSCMILGLVDNT